MEKIGASEVGQDKDQNAQNVRSDPGYIPSFIQNSLYYISMKEVDL